MDTILFPGSSIEVKEGSVFNLSLPSVNVCGPYMLLSPALRPVAVVENVNVTSVITEYKDRASMATSSDGFTLTLRDVVKDDGGVYTVAASLQSLSCMEMSFPVTVVGR